MYFLQCYQSSGCNSSAAAVLVYVLGLEQWGSYGYAYFQNFAKTVLAGYFDNHIGYADNFLIDSDSDCDY